MFKLQSCNIIQAGDNQGKWWDVSTSHQTVWECTSWISLSSWQLSSADDSWTVGRELRTAGSWSAPNSVNWFIVCSRGEKFSVGQETVISLTIVLLRQYNFISAWWTTGIYYCLRSLYWRPRFSPPGILQYFSLQHPLQHLNGHPSNCWLWPKLLNFSELTGTVFPTWYCRIVGHKYKTSSRSDSKIFGSCHVWTRDIYTISGLNLRYIDPFQVWTSDI